jgi:transcriptional regulator with XRE-family HTH domain
METPQCLQSLQVGCSVCDVTTSFADLLRVILAGYAGTKTEFAREAGIGPSIVSRLLGGGLPPVPDVCLRIARAGGVSASVVLRTAGHARTADVIEQLYGPARRGVRPEGTAADRALFTQIRSLDPVARKAFQTLVVYYLDQTAGAGIVADRPRRRSAVGRRRRQTADEKQTA